MDAFKVGDLVSVVCSPAPQFTAHGAGRRMWLRGKHGPLTIVAGDDDRTEGPELTLSQVEDIRRASENAERGIQIFRTGDSGNRAAVNNEQARLFAAEKVARDEQAAAKKLALELETAKVALAQTEQRLADVEQLVKEYEAENAALISKVSELDAAVAAAKAVEDGAADARAPQKAKGAGKTRPGQAEADLRLGQHPEAKPGG